MSSASWGLKAGPWARRWATERIARRTAGSKSHSPLGSLDKAVPSRAAGPRPVTWFRARWGGVVSGVDADRQAGLHDDGRDDHLADGIEDGQQEEVPQLQQEVRQPALRAL